MTSSPPVAPPDPPLVLVAGLAGSGLWWRRVVPLLEGEGRRVVLAELPGFGALGGHRRLLPIVGLAEWLADRLDADPETAAGVDLVGYSLGGSVCARVAAARPDLVRRLVLVAPGGVPTERSSLADLGSLLHMGWRAGPSFWPTLVRDARRAGLRAIDAAGRDVRGDDATPLFSRITAPTVMLWGDRDTLVPRRDIDRIAAGIAGARTEVFPGVGHVPMAECPERLAAAIAGFVSA